ncbi:MAG: AMIN domain-containing protein [Sulfurimonas sp.]
MIKLLFVMSIFFLSLNARENPFFNQEAESVPITSNENTSLSPLKQASLSLPSTARVIQSVSIKYKNLDGSEQSKSILLNNAIDWHLPLFVSQSYQTLDESLEKPKSKSKVRAKTKDKKLLHLKFISFFENNKTLKVKTNDKMIRNFLLVRPHRIVFDFKRDIDIRSYIKNSPKDSIFTKIRIGNHKGYYRVVVELDGYYSYKLHHTNNQYTFKLH